MKSIKVDFKNKSATAEFDESVLSAQEVARAMLGTPHMMGRDMEYGGILLLSVDGLKDEAAGKKASAALSKVEGIAKVTPYPKHQAVGVEFTGKGKVTTKQLIDALDAAGLKGGQYGMASRAGGQAMNGGNDSMREHAGMQMGNGGMAGPGGMGDRMGRGYGPYAAPFYGSGAYPRGGCGCGCGCGR